jgi:hypothetical protein
MRAVLRSASVEGERRDYGALDFKSVFGQPMTKKGGAGSATAHFLKPPLAQSVVQAAAHIVREREKFAIAVKLDRLARRIKNDFAMHACTDVRFEIVFQLFVHLAFEIA